METQSKGWGIASLVMGIIGMILSVFAIGIIFAILAVVFYFAQKRRQTTDIATAGLVVGIIALFLSITLGAIFLLAYLGVLSPERLAAP